MFLPVFSLYSKNSARFLLERVILWAEIGCEKSRIDIRQRVNGIETFKLAVLGVRIYMDY
jgi:hypothetical protein